MAAVKLQQQLSSWGRMGERRWQANLVSRNSTDAVRTEKVAKLLGSSSGRRWATQPTMLVKMTMTSPKQHAVKAALGITTV